MKRAIVFAATAALSAASGIAEVIMPDDILSPEGVEVKIASDGTVRVRSEKGTAEEIQLLWRRPMDEKTAVLRDDWERTYTKAGWTTVKDNPGSAWYVMIHDQGLTDGYGVEVQPNALAWWSTSTQGITLTIDMRAGSEPVALGTRTLEAVKLVMRRGKTGESAYQAGRAFCQMMCPKPRLPKEPVYGYNDWYCAYGFNTATNFLEDAKYVVSLCEGLKNRPYVVMDDGWQPNSPPIVKKLGYGSSGWGPWNDAGKHFGMDMKTFCGKVAALGAKPGLWYRPFRAWDETPDDQRLKSNAIYLDPTHPALKKRIYDDIRRFGAWGMKLVKIDYLTWDLADQMSYAGRCGGRLVKPGVVWQDKTRTTAEVVKDLYQTMRAAAGDDMIIIGCNALNHFAAGLFELQRGGGDTSGWRWNTTLTMGVNTLAARSIQDRTFFACDGDCIGLAKEGAIPWSLNKQWLDLLARSGTPLFVSWKKELATREVREALKAAYAKASKPQPTGEPLDWFKTLYPTQWRFGDGEATYDWGAREAEMPGFYNELAAAEVVIAKERFVVRDAYGLRENLKTVDDDLNAFRGETGRVLVLKRGPVDGYESYRVDVAGDTVTLTAEDDEGMRRAVYYFEARVQAGDLASTQRKPWIKNRISRCFFGPIKRPPNYTDELMNDIDYYPDAYLNRLAHEGINGLWLTVEFRDIEKTPFRPVSATRERRLAKLKKTVDKCLAYGIKTWIFCIEPFRVWEDDPLWEKHPDMFGPYGEPEHGHKPFHIMCASVPKTREYLEAATRSIFQAVPKLGGILAITHGERPTTCLSFLDSSEDNPKGFCERCNAHEPWELHNFSIGAMTKGMRSVNPKAEFISWFYQPMPKVYRGAWNEAVAQHLPEGVIFQYNFESGGEKEQLGRTHVGGDYWLSYEGPSRAFRKIAQAARQVHAPLSAKIQVGCSHEDATVPFIPAPGLLYRKYREMKKAGVSSVMQCWYFGNYPGTMNAAAGELAFETFGDDEAAFLKRLAAPEWGRLAPLVSETWANLTRGYMEYPMCNNIQYYGPCHSGLTWPLIPDISMEEMPRSWKPQDTPHGDMVGECLANHSLDEALTLFDRGWRIMCGEGGVDPLEKLDSQLSVFNWRRKRDVSLMKVLRYQFENARNIFEFYKLRRDAVYLSREKDDFARALAHVERMKAIVEREREIGREVARFCYDDCRLGYHSESEDYRFNADKITRRTDALVWTIARLNEIAAELRAGHSWPRGEIEKKAPVWRNCRWQANGGLQVDGDAPICGCTNDVYVYAYDACAATHVMLHKVRPTNGCFRVTFEPGDWFKIAASKPAWLMFRQLYDPKKFEKDNCEAWPPASAVYDRPDYRLNLCGIWGDRFGRIEPQKQETEREMKK